MKTKIVLTNGNELIVLHPSSEIFDLIKFSNNHPLSTMIDLEFDPTPSDFNKHDTEFVYVKVSTISYYHQIK